MPIIHQSAKPLQISKRSNNNNAFNSIAFPNGLLEIRQYTYSILDSKSKNRKYIIEVHKYEGFAMFKFYPFHLKKSGKRYEARGVKELGYCLPRESILNLIYESTVLMINYLFENPFEFVGYIGQVDKKDNIKQRTKTQRSSVYDPLTSLFFNNTRVYRILKRTAFSDINLRLIRFQISEQSGRATSEQMRNYNSFIETFESSKTALKSLMTEATRKKRGI